MKRTNIYKLLSFLIPTLVVGLLLFLPQITHAAAGDIHNSLISDGSGPYRETVIGVWRTCLALANIFVVGILVFLAVVNIAHISYDTYNLRKTLPWLIIGIILANFSLLICRMFVDVADIITNTFTGPDIVTSVVAKLYTNLGIADIATGATAVGGAGIIVMIATGGLTAGVSIAIMLLILLILFLPFIGLIAIVFLLYIRVALVLFLTMVAPLAFIMLAFPVTQQFFKQWWTWFLKWVFMKPITFFLLWAAAELGTPPSTGGGGPGAPTPITFAITIALSYLSLIAPFKLGGSIMQGWGKVGKYLPGKGLKAAGKWADDEKKLRGNQAKAWVYNRNPLGIGGMMKGRSEDLKSSEENLKGAEAEAWNHMSDRTRARIVAQRHHAESRTENEQAEQEELKDRLESGRRIEALTDRDYLKLTGHASALESSRAYLDTTNRLVIAKSAMAKRREIATLETSFRDYRNHQKVLKAMKRDAAARTSGIDIDRYDSNGTRTMSAGAAGNDMIDYASLINLADDTRARAQTATSPAEQEKFDRIARRYEEQARAYREANQTRYDYDLALDRNTSGRRLKEFAPRCADEGQTIYQTSTGESSVTDTDDPNDAFGSGPFRGYQADMDNAITGNWNDIEDTAAEACLFQEDAWNRYLQDAKSGTVEGKLHVNALMNRFQGAYSRASASPRAYKKTYKVGADTRTSTHARSVFYEQSLHRMKNDQRNRIAVEMGYADYAAFAADAAAAAAEIAAGRPTAPAVTSYQARLDALDISQMETNGPSDEAVANRAFIEQLAYSVKSDDEVALSKNPGIRGADVNANATPTA